MVDLHGGAESLALVNIEGRQHLISLFYRPGLLPVGQQQIFFQAPVQKSSDSSHLRYGEKGGFSQGQPGFPGGGDEPVAGILVQKHLQLCSRPGALRHLFRRKKNPVLLFISVLLRQIYAEIYFFYHLQPLFFS